MQKLSWLREGNVLLFVGKLNQDVLNPLWNNRFEIMQGVTQLNLSAVTYIDTSGLALLVHLIDIGKKQNCAIKLIGINNNILVLARLYNLPYDILPV